MGLRERGHWLVRQDKDVERTRPKIVSINDPDLVKTFHEFRFKRDEAVKIGY